VYKNLINQHTIFWIVAVTILTTTVHAAHFQQPVSSTVSCDFYTKIEINGLPADISDEVAFFDPQGTLCGLHIVEQISENAIIHIFGDRFDTQDIDEGATEQDTLLVRIWDASESKEYAGSDIQLSVMRPVSDYFTPSALPPVWQANQGFALKIDTQPHFQILHHSPQTCNYIGDIHISERLAKSGDEIAVFDPDGILCGSIRITEPGKYGMLHVYGDNPVTLDIDEGAIDSDPLTFKIWDSVAGVEIQPDHIEMTSGEPMGSFTSSSVPPVWTNFGGYHLDLSTDYQYQSISLNPTSIEILAGNSFELTAMYQVSDDNTQLEGVSLRLYYDSAKLSYETSEDIYNNHFVSKSEIPVQDETNSDNDTDTDQFITITWNGENWPNQELPLKLLKSVFSVKDSALPGVTYINSQCIDTADGYYGGHSRIKIDIINPAATIYGRIHYSGGASEGTYYVGVWDPRVSSNWRTSKPIRMYQCDQNEFLMRLSPGEYILGAYKDLDHQGNLNVVDIDDTEPYGFYSENSDPAFLNLAPVAIKVDSGDVKACHILILDWPVIQSFELSKESIPDNYPSIFPSGDVLKAVVSIAYGSKIEYIQKVELDGPNMNTARLRNSGQLPDQTKGDAIFSSWAQVNGTIEPGPYTITVSSGGIKVWQSKTIDLQNLNTPVILEPDELASTFVTFKWQPVANAHHYQLFLLKPSNPKYFSDYLLVKPFIEATEYIPTFQELSLSGGETYYYYITAVDTDGVNLSYSDFSTFTTDDADPTIMAIERKPPESVKAGPLDLTIVFTERMDTSFLPTVLWLPGENHFTGSFTAPNIWTGSYLVNDGDDGLKTLHISNARDIAENFIKPYTQHTFVIDTVLPEIAQLNLTPESPVAQGNVTFTIQFSEIMNINQPLSVRFGKYLKPIFGNYITNDTWSGTYHITKGYDGNQIISVSGGVDMAGNGMEINATHEFFVDTTPPLPPSGFVGERNEYQVNLTWEANTELDLQGYYVYKDGKRINANTFTQTHYSENIASGKTYIYAVTAMDRLGLESPFSAIYAVTSESMPPVISHPINESALTEFNIIVRGKAEPAAIVDIFVNNVQQKSVVAKSNGDFSQSDIPIVQGENTITAISTNAYGVKSEPSVPIIVTNDPVPLAPQGIELVASDTRITIAWQANSESDIAGYHIYRHLGRQKRRLNDLPITETSYEDNHLSNGRQYVYSVTAQDTNGSEGRHSVTIQGIPIAGEQWAVEE